MCSNIAKEITNLRLIEILQYFSNESTHSIFFKKQNQLDTIWVSLSIALCVAHIAPFYFGVSDYCIFIDTFLIKLLFRDEFAPITKPEIIRLISS